MPFLVLETTSFTKLFETLEANEKEWIRKMIQQLEQNPDAGKPLGPEWLREKKYEGKRLYFLIYQKQEKTLLVAFGTKKEQQAIINHIRQNMDEYSKIVGKQN